MLPEIKIFQTSDGEAKFKIRLQNDSIWLTQKQMAALFEKDSDTIGLHLKNIFNTGELNKISTTEKYSVVQKEGNRNVKRRILHYNLDAIISVGYRVNSIRGTQFRIWSNKILKEYLVKGYVLNEKRLQEKEEQLEEIIKTVKYLSNFNADKILSNQEQDGILKIIKDYSNALQFLDDYDHQRLELGNFNSTEHFKITYNDAKHLISKWKEYQNAGELFGNEKDESFKSSLATIYQTFEGKDLYPSIEEKAANLIYFIVKNHSFTDGNKRIAAAIFVWFIDRNKILYTSENKKLISDNTLVALTLMIAESNSADKNMIIKVIVNLIRK